MQIDFVALLCNLCEFTCERVLVEHPEEGENKCEAVVVLRVIAVSTPVHPCQGLLQAQVPVFSPIRIS